MNTMKRIFGAAFIALITFPVLAEQGSASIPLRQRSGVFEVPATLNSEIKAYFVVDSGAADVTISQSLTKLLAKNESLAASDIVGNKSYVMANGEVSVGTVVTIRQLELGDVKLSNVQAVVIEGKDTPLLLGQSVLSRLGHWSINHAKNTLDISMNESDESTTPRRKTEPTVALKKPEKQWVLISDESDFRLYANKDSIKKSGKIASIWMLFDKTELPKDSRTQSSKIKKEFDCIKETSRRTAYFAFSDHIGTGDVVYTDSELSSWDAFTPDSYEAVVFGVVCKNAKLQESTSEAKVLLNQLVEKAEKETDCRIMVSTYEKATYLPSPDWPKALETLNQIRRSCKGVYGGLSAERLAHAYAEAYFKTDRYYSAVSSATECIKLNKPNDFYSNDCLETKILSLGKMDHLQDSFTELNALVRVNLKKAKQKKTEILAERNLEKRFKLEDDVEWLEATEPYIYFRLEKFDMAIESANQCLAVSSFHHACAGVKFRAYKEKNDGPAMISTIDAFVGPYQKNKIEPLKKMLDASKNIQDRDALRTEIGKRENTLVEIEKAKEAVH